MKSPVHPHLFTPASALCLAGILSAVSALAQPVAEFDFDEGQGDSTTDRSGLLTGILGSQPAAEIRVESSPNNATGTETDRSVLIRQSLTEAREYLVVPDKDGAIANTISGGAFTAECWVNSDNAAAPAVLASFGSVNPSSGWSFGVYNGSLTFTFPGVADYTLGPPVPWDGGWHHVAVAWEPAAEGGGAITFTVDGAAMEPTIITGNMVPPSGGMMRLGAWINGQFGFSGVMDRFRLHQGVVPLEELDVDGFNAKAPLASTVLAFAFNETAAPFQSAVGGFQAIPSYDFFTDKPVWATDKPPGAANAFALGFNGSSYIFVDDSAAGLLQANDTDLTIQAWIKRTNTAFGTLLVYGSPGGYLVGLQPDGRVQFTALGLVDIVTPAQVPNDSAWHHLAVVHQNGVEVRVYVDGCPRSTNVHTRGIQAAGNQRLVLGRFTDGTLGYAGLMDRVKITKQVVSQQDFDYSFDSSEPPTLALVRSITLSWPSSPTGYTLQSAPALNQANLWADYTNAAPALEAGTYKLSVPLEPPHLYFRLIKRVCP